MHCSGVALVKAAPHPDPVRPAQSYKDLGIFACNAMAGRLVLGDPVLSAKIQQYFFNAAHLMPPPLRGAQTRFRFLKPDLSKRKQHFQIPPTADRLPGKAQT
jgi:hypothetical protein